LKQKTQEEIIDLIFDISYNPVEIWYRYTRDTCIYWQFPSEYHRNMMLYNFQQDTTKLYNWLSKKLDITTKHLFHLMHYADNEYYNRINIYSEYGSNTEESDQDIRNLINKMTCSLHDTITIIMKDYEKPTIGQYPYLN
jgi:hypothetical protein